MHFRPIEATKKGTQGFGMNETTFEELLEIDESRKEDFEVFATDIVAISHCDLSAIERLAEIIQTAPNLPDQKSLLILQLQ